MDDVKNVPLLVFANKQDLNTAMSPEEIVSSLKLQSISGREWSIQACCAKTNEGIQEGMEWLVKHLKKKE